MLARLDGWIARHMAYVAPSCLVAGILLAPWIAPFRYLVPYVFALMTFQSSLGNNYRDVAGAFRHPLPLVTAFAFLHLVMPCLAFAVAKLGFSAHPEVVTGIVLEFSIPTALVSLIWVSLMNGNMALTLSLVFLDTVLSPIFVPAILSGLVGAEIRIDGASAWNMTKGLFFAIALPALLAVTLNQATNGRVKTTLMPKLSLLTKFGFVFVITLNSTGLHPYVVEHPSWLLAGIAAAMGVLAVLGLLAGIVAARIIHAGREEAVSLTFGIGMRNIAAGATIASTYFPGQAVILPVMTATLFQQVLAATFGSHLAKSTSSAD